MQTKSRTSPSTPPQSWTTEPPVLKTVSTHSQLQRRLDEPTGRKRREDEDWDTFVQVEHLKRWRQAWTGPAQWSAALSVTEHNVRVVCEVDVSEVILQSCICAALPPSEEPNELLETWNLVLICVNMLPEPKTRGMFQTMWWMQRKFSVLQTVCWLWISVFIWDFISFHFGSVRGLLMSGGRLTSQPVFWKTESGSWLNSYGSVGCCISSAHWTLPTAVCTEGENREVVLKSDECSRVDNMKQLGPERLTRSGRVVRIQQRCVNDNLFDQRIGSKRPREWWHWLLSCRHRNTTLLFSSSQTDIRTQKMFLRSRKQLRSKRERELSVFTHSAPGDAALDKTAGH